jgi:type IV secretory pathway TrbD component
MTIADYRTTIHQSLSRPILLGGAERRLAILNWLFVAALIFGVGLHFYSVALAAVLGTAGHWGLRQAAKLAGSAFQERSLTFTQGLHFTNLLLSEAN